MFSFVLALLAVTRALSFENVAKTWRFEPGWTFEYVLVHEIYSGEMSTRCTRPDYTV